MDNVTTCCHNLPASIKTVPGDWAYQSAQIEATAIAGTQNTDIEIQTTDGDKVTLSSDITFEVAAVTYQELSRTNSSYRESQGQIVSASVNRNLELTIEGHLDDQEKKEVKMVLINLFKMIKDFISGKESTDEKQSFANLTAISGVKAEVDMSAGLTVAAQASANYISQTPLEAKPEIQQAHASLEPAVSDRMEQLTDRMMGVVKDSGIDPSKILNRLNRRFSKLSDPFINAGPALWHGMRLRRRILENFIGKLKKWMAENETETGVQKQAEAEKAAVPGHSANLETTAAFSQSTLNTARQDIHFAFEYSNADQYPT